MTPERIQTSDEAFIWREDHWPDETDLRLTPAFFIDTAEEAYALNSIHRIRSHPHVSVYLKPVFVRFGAQPAVARAADGMSSPARLDEQMDVVRNIHRRVAELAFVDERALPAEAYLLLRWLRYVYTRGGVWRPERARSATLGYHLPFLSEDAPATEQSTAVKILRSAEAQALVQGRFLERIRLCRTCSDAFLAFSDRCPRCDSAQLQGDDLVHHFPCGHVGALTDFEVTDGLRCPKCDRTLRHIGVDYDKPSIIYSCLDCDHRFQERAIKATCMACGTQHSEQQVTIFDLKELRLTRSGEQAARSGILPEAFAHSRTETSFGFFVTALKHEQARLRASGGCSSLGLVSPVSGPALLEAFRQYPGLETELEAALRTSLKPQDWLCRYGEGLFLALCPDREPAVVRRELEVAAEALSALLRDNCGIKEGVSATALLLDHVRAPQELLQDLMTR